MCRFLSHLLTLSATTFLSVSFVRAVEDRPSQSPILDLSAPREVLAGRDATFAVDFEPTTTVGEVVFELETFAGDTVWSKAAPVRHAKASVIFQSEAAADLEKGSYALVATAKGTRDVSATVGVRLRGRVFRNVTEAPTAMRPGDEIVITDTRLFGPAEAIRDVSTRGKWWRRKYRIAGSDEDRAMLCVEEHDLDDPESCLAGQFTLPLTLEGWYEVWVTTYRAPVGEQIDPAHKAYGGIDVRLSGERCFLHAKPLPTGSANTQLKDAPALVDVLYRCADLTGQNLIFQQPYGTYESEGKLCNASLAGVRLVKLSDERLAQIHAERADPGNKRIGYDNDGFSYFFVWGVHHRDCLARLLEPLRDQSTEFLNISLGGLGGIIVPTPYTEMYQLRGHTRDGDTRANDFIRWCFENDVNIVDVLTERAHEVNLKVFVSLMAERCYSPDKTIRAHPEWRIKRGSGMWDYANPEVQDYQVKKIAWICKNHDIDGFIVDYTRYGHYFNEDEPDKFQHMNDYVRTLRKAIDEVNATKERKVALCASFGERSWHLLHWGSGKLEDQGLDIGTWLEEGIFDMIMPEGPTAIDYVAMARAKNSRTKVWPRKVCNLNFTDHRYDPEPAATKELERGVKCWFDQGAAGIFFFNHDTWTTLGRLGFGEELPLRCKVDDEVFGMREGPLIEFTSWYPTQLEREEQRAALKPFTAAGDLRSAIDTVLTIPIQNTFDRPVTAVIDWAKSESRDTASPIATEPAFRSISLEPGRSGTVEFHLRGNAMSQSDVPRAAIRFLHDDQPVFRCSVPVRVVPQLACKQVTTAPTIDGRLDDPAWTGVGGVQPADFFAVGTPQPTRPDISMAIGYDDENFYFAYEYKGDVSHIDRNPPDRDSREVYSGTCVQLLLDADCSEREYNNFAATPCGGMAEELRHYDTFVGHFIRSHTEWNAEWDAAGKVREDGYSLEMAIPWKELGKVPTAGDIWRMNVVDRSLDGEKRAYVSSWSSAESAFDLPRRLGLLFGILRFQ